MAADFAEKFEQALRAKREQDPEFGLRTLARIIAKGDLKQTETVRRRLHKYRPKPSSGGAAESVPTDPTRHEIERALGLEKDALAPDLDALAAMQPMRAEAEGLASVLLEVVDRRVRAHVEELARASQPQAERATERQSA